MKKLIQKNAMALVALVIAATSFTIMSFGDRNLNTSSQWYEVSYDDLEGKHRIGSPIGPTLPLGDCEPNDENEFMCAVFYDSSNPETFVEDITGSYSVATSNEEPID